MDNLEVDLTKREKRLNSVNIRIPAKRSRAVVILPVSYWPLYLYCSRGSGSCGAFLFGCGRLDAIFMLGVYLSRTYEFPKTRRRKWEVLLYIRG